MWACRRAAWLAVLPVVALLAGCGGRDKDDADKPDCPTTTTSQQPGAPTTTVDPRCVQRATETSGDKATSQEWKGTIDGTGVNIPDAPKCPNPASVYRGDFTMTVLPDGKATLIGHMVTTSCGESIDTPFNRSGVKSGSRISFPPIEAFPWPLDLEISGGMAVGSNHLSIPTFDWTMTYRANCQNC
jgi:hypothetical protein